MADNEVRAATWRETQDLLRACTRKEQVMELIVAEQNGANRAGWLHRMRGRYRVLRNAEEDAKLEPLLVTKE